jgi:hypothetical protein
VWQLLDLGSLRGLSDGCGSHVLRLLGHATFAVKLESENYFFTTKIISVSENSSVQSVIHPLVATPDALDTPGGCAAAPTRLTWCQDTFPKVASNLSFT